MTKGGSSNEGLPECCYRVSVKALIFDETRSKFLLLKEVNGKWEVPGGGIDHNEDPRDALRREIKEETGFEIINIAPSPSLITTFAHPTHEYYWFANVFFETTIRDTKFISSNECIEVGFFTPEEALALHAFPSVPALAYQLKDRKK